MACHHHRRYFGLRVRRRRPPVVYALSQVSGCGCFGLVRPSYVSCLLSSEASFEREALPSSSAAAARDWSRWTMNRASQIDFIDEERRCFESRMVLLAKLLDEQNVDRDAFMASFFAFARPLIFLLLPPRLGSLLIRRCSVHVLPFSGTCFDRLIRRLVMLR